MSQDIFADYDAHVNHGANGNGNAGECYDVGIYAKLFHGDETHEHSKGQKSRRITSETGQVLHHDEDHYDRDEDFFHKCGVQCVECFVY